MSDPIYVLAVARELLPEVPEERWGRIEREIRNRYGADRHYIARYPKRSRLEALAEADAEAGSAKLAKMLGVSVQHARRLKKLK